MEHQPNNEHQNSGGRPNLADNEILAYRLVTRVNEGDHKAFDRDYKSWKSGKAGSRADFLRDILINRNQGSSVVGRITDKEQLVELTQTLHGIRQHLKHINTNYNQVAKRINSIEHTGKLYYEVQTSKAIIEKIAPLLDQIDALIKAETEAFFKK